MTTGLNLLPSIQWYGWYWCLGRDQVAPGYATDINAASYATQDGKDSQRIASLDWESRLVGDNNTKEITFFPV